MSTAYERYKFKHKICFKKCGLWQGKGGFCPAKRENIDYCLDLDKQQSDSRDYRNLENVKEWVEVFAEEEGLVMFELSRIALEEAERLLETSKLDCYDIAAKLMESFYKEK